MAMFSHPSLPENILKAIDCITRFDTSSESELLEACERLSHFLHSNSINYKELEMAIAPLVRLLSHKNTARRASDLLRLLARHITVSKNLAAQHAAELVALLSEEKTVADCARGVLHHLTGHPESSEILARDQHDQLIRLLSSQRTAPYACDVLCRLAGYAAVSKNLAAQHAAELVALLSEEKTVADCARGVLHHLTSHPESSEILARDQHDQLIHLLSCDSTAPYACDVLCRLAGYVTVSRSLATQHAADLVALLSEEKTVADCARDVLHRLTGHLESSEILAQDQHDPLIRLLSCDSTAPYVCDVLCRLAGYVTVSQSLAAQHAADLVALLSEEKTVADCARDVLHRLAGHLESSEILAQDQHDPLIRLLSCDSTAPYACDVLCRLAGYVTVSRNLVEQHAAKLVELLSQEKPNKTAMAGARDILRRLAGHPESSTILAQHQHEQLVNALSSERTTEYARDVLQRLAGHDDISQHLVEQHAVELVGLLAKEKTVANCARDVLWRLIDSPKSSAIFAKKAFNELLSFLNEENPGMQYSSTIILRTLRHYQPSKILAQKHGAQLMGLLLHGSNHVQLSIIKIFSALGSSVSVTDSTIPQKEAITHLLDLLSNTNMDIRQSAAGALEQFAFDAKNAAFINETGKLNDILSLLCDPVSKTRESALRILSSLDANLCTDNGSGTKLNASTFIKKEALKSLVMFVFRGAPGSRLNALKILSKMALNTLNHPSLVHSGAIASFTSLLRDPDWPLRNTAISALEPFIFDQSYDAENTSLKEPLELSKKIFKKIKSVLSSSRPTKEDVHGLENYLRQTLSLRYPEQDAQKNKGRPVYTWSVSDKGIKAVCAPYFSCLFLRDGDIKIQTNLTANMQRMTRVVMSSEASKTEIEPWILDLSSDHVFPETALISNRHVLRLNYEHAELLLGLLESLRSSQEAREALQAYVLISPDMIHDLLINALTHVILDRHESAFLNDLLPQKSVPAVLVYHFDAHAVTHFSAHLESKNSFLEYVSCIIFELSACVTDVSSMITRLKSYKNINTVIFRCAQLTPNLVTSVQSSEKKIFFLDLSNSHREDKLSENIIFLNKQKTEGPIRFHWGEDSWQMNVHHDVGSVTRLTGDIYGNIQMHTERNNERNSITLTQLLPVRPTSGSMLTPWSLCVGEDTLAATIDLKTFDIVRTMVSFLNQYYKEHN